MKRRTPLLLLISCFFLAVSLGCAPTIRGRILVPGELNLRGYKRVAVRDFDGMEEQGKNIARWVESALLDVRFEGKPYFTIVTRSRLNQVLSEHKIQMSGLTDPSTSKKIGKILGVDAIISGRVEAFDIEDENYQEEEIEKTKYGKRTVYIDCAARRSFVSFSIDFIDVETGNIEVSDTISNENKDHACGGKRYTSLPAKNDMLKQTTMAAIEQFINKILPHYEAFHVDLKDKDDSDISTNTTDNIKQMIGMKNNADPKTEIVNEYIKTGCKYASMNDWDNSLKCFLSAKEVKPESPAVNYNIGVIYQIQGNLEDAQEYYEKAAKLKPDKDYIYAATKIKQRISQRDELFDQLGKQKLVLKKPRSAAGSRKDSEFTTQAIRVSAGNIRKGPSTNDEIIATLEKGTEVKILEKNGKWNKILFSNDREGWAHDILFK